MSEIDLFMADRLSCRVAGFGLAEASRDLPAEPLSDDLWSALLNRCRFHKMVGLLAATVEEGSLPVTDRQLEELRGAHATSMELCLLLERDLLEVSALFDDAEISHRVLKGPGYAHLDYPDPSLRSFADIDLLVRSDQFDHAARVLEAKGFSRSHREIRPGFDRRFGKGANFTWPAQLRGVDLHRTFVMGPFGLTIRLEDLWGPGSELTLGGRTLVALDPEQRLLHACFHAAIGNARTRLVPLRDVAGMLERGIDVPRARALSRRWQADPVLARAVDLSWRVFDLGPTELSVWAQSFRPDAREQRALRTYLDPGMGFAARSFASLRAVPGLQAKVSFVGALLFPAQTYGSGRHRSRWARWLHAGRQILRLSATRGRSR